MQLFRMLVIVLSASCAKEGTSVDRPDGGVTTLPDGKIVPIDAASTELDAETALTDCDEATTHSDLAWLEQKVFTPSCATAMCHAGAEPEVGLNLSAGVVRANLVNRGTSTVSGWIRVVPGNLEASYLVVAFGRTAGPPPRDGFMPLGADPLCAEKLEAVERWILAGAQP